MPVTDAVPPRVREAGGTAPAVAVCRRLLTWVEGVRRREVATATDRLAARGELTPTTRRAVERLSGALVADLLASVLAGVADGSTGADGRAVATLFDLDARPPVTDAPTMVATGAD